MLLRVKEEEGEDSIQYILDKIKHKMCSETLICEFYMDKCGKVLRSYFAMLWKTSECEYVISVWYTAPICQKKKKIVGGREVPRSYFMFKVRSLHRILFILYIYYSDIKIFKHDHTPMKQINNFQLWETYMVDEWEVMYYADGGMRKPLRIKFEHTGTTSRSYFICDYLHFLQPYVKKWMKRKKIGKRSVLELHMTRVTRLQK